MTLTPTAAQLRHQSANHTMMAANAKTPAKRQAHLDIADVLRREATEIERANGHRRKLHWEIE